MSFSIRIFQLYAGCLALLSFTASVRAGPVELFRNTQQNPTQPDHLVAAFIYGNGGLFISSDGGKSFGLTCSGAENADLKFERDISQFAISGDGSIYIGLFNGLWKGKSNGCGFAEVPELKGHIIGALTVDPIDPNRVYVGTSDGYNADGTPKSNSLWVKDGESDSFAKIGNEATTWFESLHVVKVGMARRIYATGVVSKVVMDAMGQPSSEVHYYIRVSDDDAKTWTDNEYDIDQFGPKHFGSDFRIVGIDPMNPDRVLANVSREMMPDNFVFSPMQGKAGTWQQIAELGDLHGMAFAPDGKLYFGDDDQSSRSFYVVDKLGDAPKKLADNWKVSCLRWDESKKRMLACRDWQFGTVDLTTGAFSNMLDMRCAEHFVQCPDEATVKKACEAQLLAAYCGVTHYPVAPLCSGYDQGLDAPAFIAGQEYTCQAGQVVSKPDDASPSGAGGMSSPGVSGGTVASAAGQAGTSATSAGNSGAAGAGKPVSPPGTGAAGGGTKSSGCSVGAQGSHADWIGAAFAALAFAARLAVGRPRHRRGAAMRYGLESAAASCGSSETKRASIRPRSTAPAEVPDSSNVTTPSPTNPLKS